jgi:predicted N-acetyltransferase YhbS
MFSELEIHAASPEELVAAHRNVFDIWSKGLPLEEHVQSRLHSPKHRLAEWFVGCVDDRVVVSLGCYPLRFGIRGREVPGIAIGSVYTSGGFRRRGFAAQLLAWVEDHKRQDGAALSLLYSDIDPAYYARLGYVACPSLEGWRDPREFSPHVAMPQRLEEISITSHLAELAEIYACYHGAMPLAIARDDEYWAALLQRFSSDRFFALEDASGAWAGYVRLGCQTGDWQIRDYSLVDHSEELAESFYAATLALARDGGAACVGGWLPDIPAAREYFRVAPRRTEITMIKLLSSLEQLDESLISATSRFCEIDHV